MVEDNPGDVLLLREALKQSTLRFELTHLADGEEAIRAVRRGNWKPEVPGLFLLDLNLPKRDGWEILTEIRSRSELAEIPVVILSSSGAPSDLRRAGGMPNLIYIRKPPSFDEFLQVGRKIETFLNRTHAA